MTRNEQQLVVGLSGLRVDSGGVQMVHEHLVRMELPKEFTRKHLKTAQADLEQILSVVTEHPKTMVDLQNAALRNDFQTVTRLTREVGLTEDRLLERGGGKLGEIAIAAVIVAVIVVAATTIADHEPTGPARDKPDATIVDAGTGDG
jgi:hypothetical protein